MALGAVAVAAVCAVLAISGSVLAADAPPNFPKLGVFPEDKSFGAGANQLKVRVRAYPDPVTGNLYIADPGNRVSVYSPWGEFIKAWGWGVKDGSPELQVCGPSEPEPEPSRSLCREGIAGSGPGQISDAEGVAVDQAGNIYVFERNNLRVEKFNPTGQFVLMFGKEVDKTTHTNVCTAASGHECGIGIAGAGPGEFLPTTNVSQSRLTIGTDGTIYVADEDRIEEFSSGGVYERQIPLPPSEAHRAEAIAVDPASGDIYASLVTADSTFNPRVYRLDPLTGEVAGTVEVDAGVRGIIEGGLATDSAGDLFLIFNPGGGGKPEFEERILEFGPHGEELIAYSQGFAAPAVQPQNLETSLYALAVNSIGDLYASEQNAYGGETSQFTSNIASYGPPPISLGLPPKVPPRISDQYATSVDTVGATLRASINPRYWPNAKYYVDYGPLSCEASACAAQPTAPGSTLTSSFVNAPVTTGAVTLTGLSPGTTYHYRFVAESAGGGPVKGISGKPGAQGEGVFTTRTPAGKQPPCPANESFRPGPAALLPDCRAYEMVSPVDKNGADISVTADIAGDPAGLDQAALSGDALSYSAYRAFGSVESSPYTSQYVASREPGVGWSTRGVSPPREGPSLYQTIQLDTQYKAFTDDLCAGLVLQDADVPLGEGDVEGVPNLYRRNICLGGYQAIAPLKAPSLPLPSEFFPEVQGVSSDGSKAIFIAAGKLTSSAATAVQLYESNEGVLRLVCVLPNKTALKGPCSAGTSNDGRPNRGASVNHAISDDGSAIYWTDSATGPGKLYVRVNRTETFPVSEAEAHFWTAAANGSKAIYSVGGGLFEFSLASKASTLIANGFIGVVGASEDASVVYLVSSQSLASGASAGKPNLYRYEAGAPGSFKLVATLAEGDVNNVKNFLSDTAPWPTNHVSRVSPDGGAIAFMSLASLTGYDNSDASTGQPASEVYLYRAGAQSLNCVSCLPSGARPSGRDISQEKRLGSSLWAAAELPAAESQLHFPRVLSDDGSRLFFESFDPLAPRDTNSQKDVYEWEATGSGNCTEVNPGFNLSFGGCVNLISSGESPQGSEIVDSSSDGRDVFFKTESSLLSQDPGLVDIYDARAGGGFPIQQPPVPGCQGEACQNPAAAPDPLTPSSRSYFGPGDDKRQKKPLRCPKGKHRAKKGGKQVCVKNKKAKQRDAGANRRAGR